MAKEVRLPKLGETMDEGTIVDCRVAAGDHVKSGDVLFDIETDKATLEIESPADGFVKLIMAKVGNSYRVGTPLLVIGQEDEQISEEFIKSLTQQHVPKAPSGISPQAKIGSLPVIPAPKTGRRIPATRFHKLTAQKMLRSKQEIPCFYLTVRADVSELVAYRTKLNETSPVKVAYSDFVIRAVAMGLERFPIMTGQLEGDSIRLADSIGVGLAIAAPEGLVAPIVKDADKKTIIEIARYTRQLAERAKNNELTPEDLEGGCITVSNLGSLGIDSFIPIVVPGQCSILGIGRIKDVCIPDDDHLGVRKIMSITLSVDHKVANGAYAAQFLDFVKKTLEAPNEIK
jgi:pyruvate dehydrogenase E2 component (dihydrolipoamide acetyltransferase)